MRDKVSRIYREEFGEAGWTAQISTKGSSLAGILSLLESLVVAIEKIISTEKLGMM